MSALETLLKTGSVDELRTAVATLAAIVQAERHVIRHDASRELQNLAVLRGHGVDDLVGAVEMLVRADKTYVHGINRRPVLASETQQHSNAYRDATRNFDDMKLYFGLFSA